MASASAITRRYFELLSAHDLDAAVAMWAPGGVDRMVGAEELVAPQGIRDYFEQLFGAFPDFRFEILELTTARNRVAVRWRARATFAGPGRFQSFAANGARVDLEGCDVVTVGDDLIQHNEAYVDSGSVARQLGLLPPTGSPAHERLAKLANARTRMQSKLHGVDTEQIADGVWLVRGGFPLKRMNVYLIEDEGQVTMFDAGIEAMGPALGAVCARMGGLKRVVLSHADADHRGAAPVLAAPVYCHPAERPAAESNDYLRSYHDLSKLDPHARLLLSRLLPMWDGGAVQIEGTVSEGDEVAGFRVIDLPGHAPGLIGLYREADRLALVSDCIYTLDPQTGRGRPAGIAHPAFDADYEQARASIRKLAELRPSSVWAGHAAPVTGDVDGQLQRAASA